MTAVLPPLTESDLDQAQLLFQEAKQRRQRRRLASGIVATIVALLIVITLLATAGRGSGGGVRPLAPPVAAGAAVRPLADFSMRPLLCYAPPLTLGAGQAATPGPLPACSAASSLTQSNLAVTPNPGNVDGYSNSNIQPDAQFATYPSTPSTGEAKAGTELLAGTGAADSTVRYVVGPAQLTARGVKSASARLIDGEWAINLVLTGRGSAAWDALARQQFHAIIAVDLDGRVISAPITQPTQTSPTSFQGHLQISGSFTRVQAEALAARL